MIGQDIDSVLVCNKTKRSLGCRADGKKRRWTGKNQTKKKSQLILVAIEKPLVVAQPQRLSAV